MTKTRFFINILMVLLFIILSAVVTANPLMIYSDIASLILVIIIPFFIISFIYPLSEQRRLIREILSRDEPADTALLKQALEYLRSYKRILINSAILWTIMGAIAIGAHLEGPEALGLNFGVLMIVPLYAVIFLLIFIEPLRASAARKIAG